MDRKLKAKVQAKPNTAATIITSTHHETGAPIGVHTAAPEPEGSRLHLVYI